MSVGFINHARLAFNRNVEEDRSKIPENFGEKLGNAMTWHVRGLPKKVWKMANDPKVITVALTALAMLSVQMAFYPAATALAAKTAVAYVAAHVPFETAKFGAYCLSMLFVVGMGTRTLGRFTNVKLMTSFYKHHGFDLVDGELVLATR
jgi:hypothetical protein